MKIWCILLVLFLTGCIEPSFVKLNKNIDPNNTAEFRGEAANIIATQIANNMQTSQSMLGDVFEKSGILFAGLIIAMVGGFVFWGFTHSRYGWVIPASCLSGIAAILAFVNYSRWIFFIVLIICGLLLIWKAVEYHKERDIERLRNGK